MHSFRKLTEGCLAPGESSLNTCYDVRHVMLNRYESCDASFLAAAQALPQLAALLPEPRLRPALLEGLATGLGGLDARLAAAAASALTAQLGHCPRTGGDGAAAAEAAAAADQHGSGSGVVELLRGVLDDLQLLWQRHAK